MAFGAPAIVLYVTTRVAIPSVTQSLGLPPVVWFLTFGAFYILAPLLVIALMRLRGEAFEDVAIFRERLRFRPLARLSASDWRFALATLGAAVASSAVVYAALVGLRVIDPQELVPSFLQNSGDQSLAPLDLLYAWAAFAALSVAAQEILWRGVYLPRQEQGLKEQAWIANATGWALFHLALGWNVLLVLLPVLVVVPYAAQKRGSATVGAIVHAGAWVLGLAIAWAL